MFIAISVDMTFDIYGCPGLLIGGAYSDEAGKLLGIIEICKPSGCKYQCRSERNADPLDGCQSFELLIKL